MSTFPLTRHRDLLNLMVIDRATTDELGRVEKVWMHPPAHRVLGFICKTGPLGGPKLAFNLKQLHQLGTESIVVTGEPVATNTTEVKLLESLIGLEAWSDRGTKIGTIIDCLFNLKSGVITDYLFRADGWRGLTGGIYQLPTGAIQRFGKERVFVAHTGIRNPKVYRDGLEEKLSKAGGFLQSRYTDLSQQAGDQFQQATHDATHQVQSLTDQATQRVQDFGQQLTEDTQSLAQLAKERSQALRDQVQAKTEAFNDHDEAAVDLSDAAWNDDDWHAEEIRVEEEKTEEELCPGATPTESTVLERPQENDTEAQEPSWQNDVEHPTAADLDDDDPWL